MFQLVESTIQTRNRDEVIPGCAHNSDDRQICVLDSGQNLQDMFRELESHEAYTEFVTTEDGWYYQVHEFSLEKYDNFGEYVMPVYATYCEALPNITIPKKAKIQRIMPADEKSGGKSRSIWKGKH